LANALTLVQKTTARRPLGLLTPAMVMHNADITRAIAKMQRDLDTIV
jgi:hypothetical protein